MTKQLRYVLLLPMIIVPALAQQQPPQSPIEQALRFKLSNEMEASVQCNVVIVSNQQTIARMERDLAHARAMVSELEEKLKTKTEIVNPAASTESKP